MANGAGLRILSLVVRAFKSAISKPAGRENRTPCTTSVSFAAADIRICDDGGGPVRKGSFPRFAPRAPADDGEEDDLPRRTVHEAMDRAPASLRLLNARVPFHLLAMPDLMTMREGKY